MEKEPINLENQFGNLSRSETPMGEQVIFMLPKKQAPMKPNRIRQADNLSKLTGIWHGKFYTNGFSPPRKK